MKHITIIVLSILVITAGWRNLEKSDNTQEEAAETMPSFNMLTADNKTINLSSFKGKKVFVNLWATWCPPCRAEIPSIEKLAARTNKSKVAFIMLDLDNQFQKAITYATKNKMKVPIYYPAENLPPLFKVDGIPTTFIFDEKGKLIHRQTGSVDYNTSKYVDLLNK